MATEGDSAVHPLIRFRRCAGEETLRYPARARFDFQMPERDELVGIFGKKEDDSKKKPADTKADNAKADDEKNRKRRSRLLGGAYGGGSGG
ncbi:hypothetical protein AB0J40_34675 [Amycolatopsis sp. NPDC049691]|uniref:hypothetical protein n=2 Tax=unclassified Amycolatopsis TaxID=2618356 RepID=UPI00341CFCAA